MKKTKKQRTLSIVAVALCASLAAGILPGLAVSAKESENSSMRLGADGMQDGNTVYFGSYTYDTDQDPKNPGTTTDPVPYRILAAQGGNDGEYEDDSGNKIESENAMFLLSEYILGYTPFDNNLDGKYSNLYQDSEVKKWCERFANGEELDNTWKKTKEKSKLSKAEQAAILSSTKTEEQDGDRIQNYKHKTDPTNNRYLLPSELKNDKIFPLSAQEATNEAYGFNEFYWGGSGQALWYCSNQLITAWLANNTSDNWWLRSPCFLEQRPDEVYNVGLIDSGGVLYNFPGNNPLTGVRPALNLNRTAVLFTSPAEDGKTGTVGQLEEVPTLSSGTKEWKLTLKDEGRDFSVTDSGRRVVNTKDGDSYRLEFGYQGATIDDDPNDDTREFISAMVVDENDGILYYGNLLETDEAAETDGAVAVELPQELAEGDYTLRLFSQECNGDYLTDYASDFAEIPLTVEASQPAPKPNRPNTHLPDKTTPETPITPTPDNRPGSPDRPGSVDTKNASVPAGGTYEALVYGVTDPAKIQVTVSDPEVAGFTISSDPRGSKIQVFGKKEGKVTIKITANGIVSEMQVDVLPLGGSLLVDTKSVSIPAGQQYQIGLTLFDPEDKPYTPEQVKTLLNPTPYAEPINPEQITIRDSRTGSVVDMRVLDNGHLLLTAKTPPENPTAYLQIFYKGQTSSVKVTSIPANAARTGEGNAQRLFWTNKSLH